MISLKLKLIAFAAYTLFIALIAVNVYSKYIDSEELKINQIQLRNISKAPASIIKFQQDLRKTNAHKEPCFNTDMPADVVGLLK